MTTRPEQEQRSERLERYRDNPLVLALPDTPSVSEAFRSLAFKPPPRDSEFRRAPVYQRVGLLHELQELFVPGVKHIERMQKLVDQIRWGYSYRDPNRPEIQQALYRASRGEPTQISRLSPTGGGSNGSVIWGVTGSGKTSFMDRFMRYMPIEPIVHTAIQGRASQWIQIPCIRIQCARTLKATAFALLRKLDEQLGTSYSTTAYARSSREEYIGRVTQALTIHFVGLLIVDDVQNLKELRGRSTEVLEYFIDIMEESGIPILLMSTYAAREPLFSDAKIGSKLTSHGITDFPPLAESDPDWASFVREMWKLNIFSEPTEMPLAFPKWLHFHSMGVRRFAREMLVVAFEQAARSNLSTVDQDLLDRVARVELQKYQKPVNMLRRHAIGDTIDSADAKAYEDLLPPDLGQFVVEEAIKQRDHGGRTASHSENDAVPEGTLEAPRKAARAPHRSARPAQKAVSAQSFLDRLDAEGYVGDA